jgi:hypothetical protein
MKGKLRVTTISYFEVDTDDEAWAGVDTLEEAARLTKEQWDNHELEVAELIMDLGEDIAVDIQVVPS